MDIRSFRTLPALAAAGVLVACVSGPSKQAAPILPSSTATPQTRADLQDFPESPDNRASRSRYRTIERGGETLYCRRVSKPGSKINSEEECMSAAELRRRADASRDYVDGVVDTAGIVGGTTLF
jgi:hypothetical protein